MKLVIGGFAQGQDSFAASLSGGNTERIISDVHLQIRRGLLEGKTREMIREELFCEIREDSILTCDEVGCGIVPMDAFEREYRESVGRILCEIAGRADEVYRVLAGIGTRIK